MSKKITKTKVASGIFLLRFRTQYQLAATLLRVQEHYESPRFHGRVFSLEEYMDWYAARYGNFTYYHDWSGFNVPSTALQPFYDGEFDPLSEKEKRLLGLFKGVRGRFYIVGVYGDDKHSLTHELAHALFFTDAVYRKAVQRAMRSYDTRPLQKRLSNAGYARHVIPDETQAYLVAPSSKLGTGFKRLEPLRRELRALFRKHAKRLSIPRIR
jgi:hypothetical protein